MERYWYRQKPLLQAAVREHGSVAAVAREFGVHRATLAHWASRFGIRSGHVRTPGALNPAERPKGGCTYVIEAVGEQLYKVGRTGGDPRARLAQLRNTSPVALELVLVLDHPMWEDVLHHHYREQRRHGEWFALTPIDIDELRGWSVGD